MCLTSKAERKEKKKICSLLTVNTNNYLNAWEELLIWVINLLMIFFLIDISTILQPE